MNRGATIIVGTSIVLLGAVFFVYFLTPQKYAFSRENLEAIKTVVSIYCADGEKKTITGSGTVITEDGLILTNSHVVHELGHAYVPSDDHHCIVVIPDHETGMPDKVYTGHALFSETISDSYDLAFVQIDGPYYDDDGEVQAPYPVVFDAYTTKKRCPEPELGEPLRVYGYPGLLGGRSLIVTDGLVSGFLDDEQSMIVTSAKINRGNSGGLAATADGCIVGVPSRVRSDEIESYGIIFSDSTVSDFIERFTLEMGGRK